MQRRHPFVLLLVAGLLTGCVSASKYRELESKASTDRTSLEKDVASLRSQVASQRDEVARREAQIASLNQQISSLNQQSTDLEAKKAVDLRVLLRGGLGRPQERSDDHRPGPDDHTQQPTSAADPKD